MRAIAKQAEAAAERRRREKIIDAEGEQQAAEKLAEAGKILSGRPEAMQLRYLGALQTLRASEVPRSYFRYRWTCSRGLGGPRRRNPRINDI